MFDLTDDVENSLDTTRKVKPIEVKPIPKTLEKPEKFDENDPYNNKETLTNTVDTDDSEW